MSVLDVILQKEKIIQILKKIYQSRFVDEKMAKMVRQNKGGSFQLSALGHELIGVLAGSALIPGTDWAFPYYRDRAFAIGLGSSLTDLFAVFLAKDIVHHSGGRMMPDHFSQIDLRIPCQSSCVGSQFLQAVGVATSVLFRKAQEVVYVSGGDGSTSQGDFHEALNFASLRKLPIIFVIQDNGWAISVPLSEQTAGASIAKMGGGYEGLSVFEIDGCDFMATEEALSLAVSKARLGNGPSLVIAKVPRIGAHSSSDDPKKYKTEQDIQCDLEKDPVPRFEQWILKEQILSLEKLTQIKQEQFALVEKAALAADLLPFPDKSSVLDYVFKETSPPEESLVPLSQDGIVMMDGLNHALIEEMSLDPGVVVFGQDVAKGKGGVFGITKTLTDRFGEFRCFNTPLAESTIVGLAIGLSCDGFHKPIAEIQFADYSWTGMNQIFNELSSIHYRSKGQWNCPVVIRMPYGGYIQGGPYHSQSIEAFLCHCPGLKVVIPSNAADAKRLLKTAIRDPNPVLFLEHKALYRQRLFCARPEPSATDLLPFGKAQIVKEGTDLTLVAWGMGVFLSMQAAEQASKEGISVEVIDLRTLVPLDFETILTSLKKTNKFLIVHEAAKTCGFGAELAAKASELAFSFLDAPIMRVAGKDCPVPYSKNLEDEVLPQVADIKQAIYKLSNY